MTEYLIAFNDEWVPDYTDEEMAERSKAVRALRAEMKAAGVFVFLGGLDAAAPVFSVDGSSGDPVFTDGPYVETKEHLGGFTLVDGQGRDGLWLAAGGAALPGAPATSVMSPPPRSSDRPRAFPAAGSRATGTPAR
jgi:hypothetical protein